MSTHSNDIRKSLLEHIEAQVVFGDTKSALIVAADSILIAGYVTGVKEFGLAGMFSRFTILLLVMSLIILVAGLVLALIAVMPNSRHWRTSGGLSSVLLFSRIAKYKTAEEYVEAFCRLDEETLSNEILCQVHGKSQWALFKYKTVWYSVLLTIISVSVASIAIVIDLLFKWIM